MIQAALKAPAGRLAGFDGSRDVSRSAQVAESSREIATKSDLSAYWTRISSDGDFLRTVPSYTLIRDPLRRLCHRLIAFSIAGRSQALEKVTTTDFLYLRSMDEGAVVNVYYLLAQYLFRFASRRMQGAKIFGGHFIACLSEHFGLITEASLQWLIMVVRDLTMIDTDELVRLYICERLGDVETWVAPRPKRQQTEAATEATHVDLEVAEEGVQVDPAPGEATQVPQAAAPAPRTIPHRSLRLKDEIQRFRDSVGEQRIVLDGISIDFDYWKSGNGIFCQRCTCESCGNGAHIGYNSPPKVPIISNLEPCYNQNVDEFPQTLPSFHPTCYSKDENSFTYDSNLNFVDDSPNPPPQPLTYSYEFCGNDAHYGHDCPP
nr:hypothetical protein [Tanacetum cinerariifolium]